MSYFTNSNQIKALMTQLVDVEVNNLDMLESWSDVTVYLFDNFFTLHLHEITVHSVVVMMRPPDWGGMILELMKRNEQVYLYWSEWCCVLYRSNFEDFRFIHCSDPTMAAGHTLSPSIITCEAIWDLMEPIWFGQALADQLMGQSSPY